MANKRIGILTGGGDVPGLNTVSAIAPHDSKTVLPIFLTRP